MSRNFDVFQTFVFVNFRHMLDFLGSVETNRSVTKSTPI